MLVRPVLLIGLVALVLFAAGGGSASAATPTDVFFSEYVEGTTSNNKAVEIFNGTGASVNLAAAGYSVQMCFNGSSSCSLTINLTGTVAHNDVYVLAQSSANAAILAQADQSSGAGWFNGDDAVVLRRGSTVLDVIGQVGFDPGSEWGSGLTSTADNTLRRKPTVVSGDANGGDVFEPAVEWTGFAQDDVGGLGSHVVITGGDAAPTVTDTDHGNNAVDVPQGATISVTFSEPVATSAAAFSVSCDVSGSHPFVLSGGPTTYTLNPDSDFAQADTCSVVVDNAGVEDRRGRSAREHGRRLRVSVLHDRAQPADLRDPERVACLALRRSARLRRAGCDHGRSSEQLLHAGRGRRRQRRDVGRDPRVPDGDRRGADGGAGSRCQRPCRRVPSRWRDHSEPLHHGDRFADRHASRSRSSDPPDGGRSGRTGAADDRNRG